jgi:hypothetical protein
VENAIALLVLVSVVLGQRWVWVIAFFIAGAAPLFATFASILYLQILVAMSFLFLWLISGSSWWLFCAPDVRERGHLIKIERSRQCPLSVGSRLKFGERNSPLPEIGSSR